MTPYDTIRYPGLPYADTHPDHLAAAAVLHGMTPAPPDRCRVLEVGCGDGGNLVPMAYALPGSAFTGIDLAADAIETARGLARRAEVANVTFEALDLTQFPADAGEFDYIIAHGVYSWIPEGVRDALMALIGRHLAAQGVAFVSYNAYPGCHLRQMMWEMLKFHTAELADAQARLTEAQALIGLIAHGVVQPDEYTQPLAVEAQRMEARVPALLFHDDLSPVNAPVYFHEFADHAGRHGLQFLAEAAFVNSSNAGIAATARGVLATLDPIAREQYLDFIKCRRFRETLVCRAGVDVQHEIAPERLQRLAFTAARRVRSPPQERGAADGPEAARTVPDARGPEAGHESDAALTLAVLDALREAAPRALPLGEVIGQVRAREDESRLPAVGEAELRALIVAGVQAGVFEPHLIMPPAAFPPGERPIASAVVRAQLDAGDVVASIWHQPVKIDDDVAKRLLPLLDGTRDRQLLLAAAEDLLGAEEAKAGAAALDAHLRRLARLGLIVA